MHFDAVFHFFWTKKWFFIKNYKITKLIKILCPNHKIAKQDKNLLSLINTWNALPLSFVCTCIPCILPLIRMHPYTYAYTTFTPFIFTSLLYVFLVVVSLLFLVLHQTRTCVYVSRTYISTLWNNKKKINFSRSFTFAKDRTS